VHIRVLCSARRTKVNVSSSSNGATRIRTDRHVSHAPSSTVQGSEREMSGVVFGRSALVNTVGIAVHRPLLSNGARRLNFSPSVRVTHRLAAVNLI